MLDGYNGDVQRGQLLHYAVRRKIDVVEVLELLLDRGADAVLNQTMYENHDWSTLMERLDQATPSIEQGSRTWDGQRTRRWGDHTTPSLPLYIKRRTPLSPVLVLLYSFHLPPPIYPSNTPLARCPRTNRVSLLSLVRMTGP